MEMSEHYQLICPDCRTELPRMESPKICPTCNKDLTNSYEILFRPAAQNPLTKKIAFLILVALGIMIIVTCIAAYR